MEKKMYQFIYILIILLTLSSQAYSEGAITIGPMVNFNFGDKLNLSYTLEVSYWSLDKIPVHNSDIPGVPIGIDLGLEFSKDYTAIYSEAQIGAGSYGISAGPCLFFQKGNFSISPQATAWFNIYAGAAYRWRPTQLRESSHNYILYAKALFDDKLNWVD